MNVRLPIGARLTKAYYVILPFTGANQAAGQVVDQTESDDFVEARDIAVVDFWMKESQAAKMGKRVVIEDRPVLVHRFCFEFPEGGGADIELEREILTDGMIEVAERTTMAGKKDMITMMAQRARHVFTDQSR